MLAKKDIAQKDYEEWSHDLYEAKYAVKMGLNNYVSSDVCSSVVFLLPIEMC